MPRHKEMSNSQTNEGFVDLPLDAAAWLIHFKSQNQTLLKSENVSTQNITVTCRSYYGLKMYIFFNKCLKGVGLPCAMIVGYTAMNRIHG